MYLKPVTIMAALFAATATVASSDFGSEDDARVIASQMIEIISSQGLAAGIDAMHNESLPFSTSRLGIHIFEDSIIVGDNREPELIASSYIEVQDLTGQSMWPRIVAAADSKSDAILEWYHYDTEAEYSYACYSEWAIEGSIIVMVCR